MIDLTTIDDDTLMARGAYSTYNAAHKDSMKELQILCGELSSVASKVIRHMQPDGNDVPEHPQALLAVGRATLDGLDACAARVIDLMKQKATIKQAAWGRK